MSDINEINRDDYSGDRKVVIQAIGSLNQKRRGKYTIIVPYSRLSQTIQQISKNGGRIVNISINSSSLIEPKIGKFPVEKHTEISLNNISQADLITEAPKDHEPKTIETQPLTPAKTIESETSQKETVILSTPPPITYSKIEKKPNKPRRKKLQFDRATNFKKTTRNTAKLRGKKTRKHSKLALS
jgi:CpcD/allophycocyanin linker domain